LKVLLVDDDPDFANLTRLGLEPHGVQCVTAQNGEEAALALEEQPGFDLILLDIEMPGVTGWDLLTNLREAGEDIPVLFVSGLQAVEHRVRGLRMGADDYLVKPIDHEELYARIEAVLRRRAAMPQLHFGDLRLDLAQRRACRGDRALHLSPKEFDLLLALTRGKGEVLSRSQLLEQVWDMTFDPGTNLLDVHIGRLRRKVDRQSSGLIQTVRGKGYRLQVAHATTD
jgi:two-component system copper resistance phosphate regulon response regulator CusR